MKVMLTGITSTNVSLREAHQRFHRYNPPQFIHPLHAAFTSSKLPVRLPWSLPQSHPVIGFQGCSAASQTIASRLLSPKVSRAVLRMLFSRLLRDCFLQGCFATALSLRLLRNGPLSKVALRSLSLGCSATALSYPGCFATILLSWVASRPLSCPGLLRDHSLVLGCFATDLSWVASRPLFCPGLLRDHSLVLGCFATDLSWVASRPLSCPGLLRDRLVLGCFATTLLSWVASRPLSCLGLLRDRLVLGCFATTLLSWVASRPPCPGLLRDRSLLLGCFATALLSWVASRPLSRLGLFRDRSLSKVAPRPLFPSFMLR